MADVITEPSQVPQPAAHVSADAIAGILDGPAAGDAIVSRRPPWLLLLLLALAGGIAAAAPIVLPFLGRRDATDSLANHPSHTVARRDLTISVTESATLASAENVEVRCEVKGGTTIIWLVDDGTHVKQGDKLAELDAAKISEDLTAQKIALEKARATAIQADKDFEASQIAVEEYVEGTYRKEQHKARSDRTGAIERLQAARNLLAHNERMFRKGYITPQQLDTHKAKVERAQLDVDTAEIALDVLERFTKPKMVTELESKRDANAAKRESEAQALKLEGLKLQRLEQQLAKCTITAPKDGIVIYPATSYWNRDAAMKTGAKVNEAQTILQMPDLSTMRADVGVHESKIDKIRVGMPARIDLQGAPFTGKVTTVATRPNPNSYVDTAKRYDVKVDIDEQSPRLRPGLTAEVEIVVAGLRDVIAVPVAAVAEQRDAHVCAVYRGGVAESRTVTLGQSNDEMVEITSGLEPGDVVLLNPRAVLAANDLPGGDGGRESTGRPPAMPAPASVRP
jgi:HlyD family secretion protein